MILITGASGHLGKATLDALIQKGTKDVAVLARNPEKVKTLSAQGIDIRQGDYEDLASLTSAMQGIDTLLFVSTSEVDGDVRARQHGNVVQAAKAAGVQHIVYTSMLHASMEAAFLPAASHFVTEQALRDSGINYTVLRNTFYAGVAVQLMGDALQSGQWYFAGGDAKANFAARSDMAEALALVLLQPSAHHNKIYEIANSESHTCAEIAAITGELVGKTIHYVAISNEALQDGMRQAGLPEPIVVLLASGAKAIAQGELDSNDRSLEQILGRKPLSLKEALRLELQA